MKGIWRIMAIAKSKPERKEPNISNRDCYRLEKLPLQFSPSLDLTFRICYFMVRLGCISHTNNKGFSGVLEARSSRMTNAQTRSSRVILIWGQSGLLSFPEIKKHGLWGDPEKSRMPHSQLRGPNQLLTTNQVFRLWRVDLPAVESVTELIAAGSQRGNGEKGLRRWSWGLLYMFWANRNKCVF